MEENKNKFQLFIDKFEFSKYTMEVVQPSTSTKWTLNGTNNANYNYIKECYEGSVTNGAIINAFYTYIYANGLIDKNGSNINKYITKKDLKKIVLDYKTYGAFAIQVIWNSAKNIEDKKPIRLKYLPVYKIGLNIDDKTQEINGYWYSFDWSNQSKYQPQFFQKFDGRYKFDEKQGKGNDIEILMIQRTSSEPFYAKPDYVAGLQEAEKEMELSNYSINRIKNGFNVDKVVNIPMSAAEDDDLREELKRKVVSKLTGTQGKNNVVVGFFGTAEEKITIDSIPVNEENTQYTQYKLDARENLIVAHSAPPILFASSTNGGGLGNNADEIEMATAMLMRKHIYPMREDIIDGLNEVFNFIDSSIELEFIDFPTFTGDKREELQ